MKIVTVVGARPQFIKLAPVSVALQMADVEEISIHTGQHYDREMSQLFYDQLGIRKPTYNLGIGSGSHGKQTGEMLHRIEEVLLREKPGLVLVFGDTNSTLAGALAANKLHIRVAHVEAGLRSFNRLMPEETNRVLADHVSDLLLCPTLAAVENLRKEGIVKGVYQVGDVMFDALIAALRQTEARSDIIQRLGLASGSYLLLTLHRAENTDNPMRLRAIIEAANQLGEIEPVIFPVHPRTRKAMSAVGVNLDCRNTIGNGREVSRGVRMVDPIGYFDMVKLIESSRLVLTDSGGLQKEAYWLRVPCITLRTETEWVETVQAGWNQLVDADSDKIIHLAGTVQRQALNEKSLIPGWESPAAPKIAEIITSFL
jgi:UDP-N-acetylglucosamine 2-epimerase